MTERQQEFIEFLITFGLEIALVFLIALVLIGALIPSAYIIRAVKVISIDTWKSIFKRGK